METREWDLLKLFEDRHIMLHGATVHYIDSNLHRGTNEALFITLDILSCAVEDRTTRLLKEYAFFWYPC